MAGRGVRTDTDRIDDDRVPPNEHGRAVAVGGHDGAMQVVGDEPIHHRGAPAGRDRRPGVRRGAQRPPRQSPMYAHVESTTGTVAVGGRG